MPGGSDSAGSTPAVSDNALIERQLENAPELEYQVVEGVEQLTHNGRVIAEVTPDGQLAYVYDGYGGPIVSDADRATTLIGKFKDPNAPNGGIRYFLGDAADPTGFWLQVDEFPDGSIRRGEGGDAGPGDLNFLDVAAWDGMFEANRAKVLADPDNARLTDAQIGERAHELTSDEFWVAYNLPYLEEAFKRGDTVRAVSDPGSQWGGLYDAELKAIRGTRKAKADGLAFEYGYVFDGASDSWVKLEDGVFDTFESTPTAVARKAEEAGLAFDEHAGTWVKLSESTFESVADSPIRVTRPGGLADQQGLVFDPDSGKWVKVNTRHSHVLDGEFNKRGKPTGGHYLREPTIRPVDLSDPDRFGITRGLQERRNPTTGRWVLKTNQSNKPQTNTYFPDLWTKRQTELEINHAFRNSKPDPDDPGYWVGRASDGTPITGAYNTAGDITGGWANAYPIYNYLGKG